jgi:CobQ-like glutamine amidotransferase family enzyme
MRLRLVHLYGDLMNLYGDRGNIIALQRRCEWRNIELEVAEVTVGDRVNPAVSDILFFGGGQDREQETVSRDLAAGNGEAIQEAVEEGAALLSVCGGYQLLGRFFRTAEGVEIPGVGLFDAYTVAGGSRMAGNLLVDYPLNNREETLIGFENHSGKTYLGSPSQTESLGHVVRGHGNNGEDQIEGARYRGAIGTYLHGPVLPKNPWLTDWLIRTALRRHVGEDADLSPLDDARELEAHAAVERRLRREGNVRTSIR